jgi:hypothetical protein
MAKPAALRKELRARNRMLMWRASVGPDGLPLLLTGGQKTLLVCSLARPAARIVRSPGTLKDAEDHWDAERSGHFVGNESQLSCLRAYILRKVENSLLVRITFGLLACHTSSPCLAWTIRWRSS